MGIQDREYSRHDYAPRSSAPVSFGGMNMMSVTTWLIAINVVVFLLDQLTTSHVLIDGMRYIYQPITLWGQFTTDDAIFKLQLWRFLTFQFLHAGFTHLLFNMLGLYFFGPLIESYLGRWRYLAFYLLCGMAGPISYLLFYGLHVAAADRGASLIGASAGVFGVLVAAARIAPNVTVLIYGVIPARLRTVAWVLLGIAVYTVFTNGHNAGGEAAHLGGAALGYVLIKNSRWLDIFDFSSRRWRRQSPRVYVRY